MTSMWGRWGNANGRSLAARVQGQVAADSGSRGNQDPAHGRGEAAGIGGIRKAAPGRPGSVGGKAPAGRSKYGNQRVTWNGQTFDSRREMERYSHLLLLERAGHIQQLERQVVFVLSPAVVIAGRKRPALRYVADFVYRDAAGNQVTEDAKGAVTDVYRVKRHLMKAVHGIDIREV